MVIIIGFMNWLVFWCLLRIRSLRQTPINAPAIAMSFANGLCCTLAAPMELYDVIRSYDDAILTWCRAKIGLRAFCFNTIKVVLFGIALTRLIIGCHSKPMKLNFIATCAICVLGNIGGLLAMLHNINPNLTPIRVCLGEISTTDRGEDWSFYFILNMCLFMMTILCYLLLVISLRVRAFMANSLTVPHFLNDSAVVLSSKAAMGVTIVYSISFLSPFISKIIPLLDLVPEPPLMLHYIAYYSALIYIQAAASPLAFIITNRIVRKRTRGIIRSIFRPHRAAVVPHIGNPHP